jgi:hypothetical protein
LVGWMPVRVKKRQATRTTLILSTDNAEQTGRSQSCDALSQFTPQFGSPMHIGQESKRDGMTEQNDRLARERNEIAARIADFKATQEKFKREREEYYVTTLENARNGSDGKAFWS